MISKGVSPSRTYVAVCNKTNFDGHYFKKFVLPRALPRFEGDPTPTILENTEAKATWYFLNYLDFVACVDGSITAEDFANVTDQK